MMTMTFCGSVMIAVMIVVMMMIIISCAWVFYFDDDYDQLWVNDVYGDDGDCNDYLWVGDDDNDQFCVPWSFRVAAHWPNI